MSAKQLANSLPDAVFILDETGKIIWWNNAATQLFTNYSLKKSLSPADLIGKENFAQCWNKQADIRFEAQLPNYKHISYELKHYNQNRYLLIMQDMSRTHHLERMRKDFVANVSHELRTPLTVIHGFLELLSDQADDKQHLAVYHQMQHQTTRMQTIIEELLFLARLENVEHQNEDYQRVNVSELVDKILQDAKKLSQEQHELVTDIDNHLNLFGIYDELHSLFSNLIFNSIKYTPAPGRITVRWFKKNSQACFQVQDTGIGIAQKHIPRITERFYRVDKARSSETGGTGLGLAIVKHVLIHHQGTLTVDSKLGEGSTFTCLFPEKLSS